MISKETFSKEVDEFILDTNSDVMSAIIKVAENRKIDLESIAKFISPSIKNRLEAEALVLKMVKPRARLPI